MNGLGGRAGEGGDRAEIGEEQGGHAQGGQGRGRRQAALPCEPQAGEAQESVQAERHRTLGPGGENQGDAVTNEQRAGDDEGAQGRHAASSRLACSFRPSHVIATWSRRAGFWPG